MMGTYSWAEGIHITATTTQTDISKLYLYSIYDEIYGYLTPLDSIELKDGASDYRNDTLRSQVIFMTASRFNPQTDLKQTGSFLFLTTGDNIVTLHKDNGGPLRATVRNSSLDNQYQDFLKQKYLLSNRPQLDSLDALFLNARAKADTAEMRRIRRISDPVYEQGVERFDTWRNRLIESNKGTAFGAYLFYTYRLAHAQIETVEELDKVRAIMNAYDDEARQTEYFYKIKEKIAVAEKSVVGQKAPDIEGLSRADKPMTLAGMRGKYVIVDFWSSGCKWCRAETPYLKKTYERFKDRNFTILGVSTDVRKTDWVKAIQEDGATWEHLILPKATRARVLEAYSIVAIPEIILVGPDGHIVAKGLRGDAIYEAVEKAMAAVKE